MTPTLIREGDAFVNPNTGRVTTIINVSGMQVHTVWEGERSLYSYGLRFFKNLIEEGKIVSCEAPFL